jgi:hypothetical protein
MEEISVGYFNNLFASSNPSAIDEVIHLVDTAVTPSMNLNLLMPFFFFFFSQKYWHIIGGDVSKAILDFLNCGRMLGCLNFTNIVLIPKVKAPECMSQFRPISLCNVLYKIISKVLVNRMKTMLIDVISDYQSAFVPR